MMNEVTPLYVGMPLLQNVTYKYQDKLGPKESTVLMGER